MLESARHPARRLRGAHQRLVARLGRRGVADRSTPRASRAHPVVGALLVAAAGLFWGTVIGAVAGAIVGFTFYGIGAFYGFFVGGAVGAAVAVPATIVLVGLLLVRHGRWPTADGVVGTVAALFAVLAELVLIAAVVAGGAGLGWTVLRPYPEAAHVFLAVIGVGLLALAWATVVALLRLALSTIVGLWLALVPPEDRPLAR